MRPEDFAWLAERAEAVFSENATGIAALDAIGRIRGAVAFDGWTPNAVVVHARSDTPIVWRTLAPEAFRFGFEHRGVMLATVRSDNPLSLRLCDQLGFESRYRIRDAWEPGVDLVLFEMRRSDCPWLASKWPHRRRVG